MLRTKSLLHSFVGALAVAPFSGPERECARQLAEGLPLAPDEAIVAAARGLQLAGIFACVGNGTALSQCACYIDVAERDVKPMLRALLGQATQDWAGLGELA